MNIYYDNIITVYIPIIQKQLLKPYEYIFPSTKKITEKPSNSIKINFLFITTIL